MGAFWKRIEIYCKAVVNLLVFIVTVLAVLFLLPYLLRFFMPFVIGAVIAWISGPLVRFFEKKLKVRRKMGTAMVIITVIAIVVILGYLLVAWIVDQAVGFLSDWPQMWESIQRELEALGARITQLINYLPEDMRKTLLLSEENLSVQLGDMVSGISLPTFEAVGRFAMNLPTIIVSIVMCLLSAYFFISDREFVSTRIPKYLPKGLAVKWRLILNSIKRSVGGYFKAQLKIECWVYLLMVVGFFILDLDYAFFIAFGIALLDFFPIFGTGTVLIPWALIKFVNSDYFAFAGLLIIWGVGQLVRQIIQPKIMGDTIGVHPIPTLFLLYVGFRVAGVMGMIAALPIGIILLNLYQAGAFDTTQKSLRILMYGLKRFRSLEPEQLDKKS